MSEIYKNLLALQRFQITIVRAELEKENPEDEEILPKEETLNEYDLSRKEIEQQEKDYL